jgi:hypothetical protein
MNPSHRSELVQPPVDQTEIGGMLLPLDRVRSSISIARANLDKGRDLARTTQLTSIAIS